MVSHLSASHRAHSAVCRWSGFDASANGPEAWCAAQDDDADTPYRRSLRPQLCIHANHTLIICSPLRSSASALTRNEVAAMPPCPCAIACFDLRRMPCLTYLHRVLWNALESACALQMPLGQTPLTPPSSGPPWTKYPPPVPHPASGGDERDEAAPPGYVVLGGPCGPAWPHSMIPDYFIYFI
jgi:hypothetical protein